jgi:hypothetical protein
MNKNLLIALLCCLVIGKSFGQITLGTADFSHANDTFRVSTAPITSSIDLTGSANYTWDYSQLTYNFPQTIDTFLSVSSLPTLIAAYFSFLKPCNQATFTSTSFLNQLGIPVNGTYDMYNNSSANFRERGIGILSDTIAAPIGYSSDDIIYKFPLAFGNMDSSTSGYTINQIPGIYYSTTKTRVNTVDGWGTLITPYGTFSVLRQQSVIHEHDSISLDTLGGGIGFDVPEAIEYKWLGAGKGIPLLQINTSLGIPTQIIYRDSVRIPIGVPEIDGISALSFDIFPNPAVKTIGVRYSLSKGADVGFEILNQEGKSIYLEKPVRQPAGEQQHFIRQTDVMSAGNYFLKISVGDKYFTKPLIVSK